MYQLVVDPGDAGDVNAVAQKFIGRADIAPVGIGNALDLAYQKTHFLALYIGDNNKTTGQRILRGGAFAHRCREVDYGHGLAANIERTQNPRVLVDHGGHGLIGNQFLDFKCAQAKYLLVVQAKQQQALGVISFRG